MTQRRPDTYTSINTNTQRTGLPSQSHKIVFLTSDTLGTNAPATEVPVAVYDSAGADKAMGTAENKTSIASRMVDAALKVSQGVDMSVANKAGGANNILCVPTSISVRNENCEIGRTYVLSISVNNSAYKEFNVTASEGDTIADLFMTAINNAIANSNEHWIIFDDGLGVSEQAKILIIKGLQAISGTHQIHNFLSIKPTLSEEVNDMYQYIMDATIDGVEIHSCSIRKTLQT